MPDRHRTTGFALSFAAAAVAGAYLLGRMRDVVLKPKDPTHRLVCECECQVESNGTVHIEFQTTDIPSGGCSTADGARCRHKNGRIGKLANCEKTAVPTALVRESIEEQRVAVR